MGIVTESSNLGKGRIRFRMDDGKEFILYRGEARQFHLQDGSILTEEQEQQLIYEVIGKRARRRAMHLLEQMDRTEQQLRDKLLQGGYPQECVELALEYVKSYHYVDDYRYACNYVSYRQDRMSRQQLKLKLAARGVQRDLIDQVLEDVYEGDEQEQIKQLLQKRRFCADTADQKEFQRTYQFLMRRGFKSSEVLHAMKSRQ